ALADRQVPGHTGEAIEHGANRQHPAFHHLGLHLVRDAPEVKDRLRDLGEQVVLAKLLLQRTSQADQPGSVNDQFTYQIEEPVKALNVDADRRRGRSSRRLALASPGRRAVSVSVWRTGRDGPCRA